MDTISVKKNKKIYAGINIKTRHVLFNKFKTSRMSDISVLPKAINNVAAKIDTLFTDFGSDSKTSYLLSYPETKVVIPPRRNALADKQTQKRNDAINYILEHRKSR